MGDDTSTSERQDFRDRYIVSLEEQIDMHKNQNALHQAQVAKLHERVRNLESQLSAESKKRKLNSSTDASTPAAANLSVTTSAFESSRPIIHRATLSLPNSPIGPRLSKLPSPLPSLNRGYSISEGRTLPPFMPTQRPVFPSTPASRTAAAQPASSPPLDSFQSAIPPQQYFRPEISPNLLHPHPHSHAHPHPHPGHATQQASSFTTEDETLSGPACDGCRIRKRKCTREKPECSYCVKLNKNKTDPIPCTYPDPNRNKIMTLTEKRLRALSEARSANNTPPTSAPSSAATSPTNIGQSILKRQDTRHNSVAERSPPDSAPISRVVSPELNIYTGASDSPTQKQLAAVSSSLYRLSTTSK